MVEDHFAILKVGPWLTYAYREAVLALAAIEHELLKAKPGTRLSQVRDALEKAMLNNPIHWQSYYRGDEEETRRELIYSYSDRCRYYWNDASVQEELSQLFDNLAAQPIPLTLVSQFLPLEYEAMREGKHLKPLGKCWSVTISGTCCAFTLAHARHRRRGHQCCEETF